MMCLHNVGSLLFESTIDEKNIISIVNQFSNHKSNYAIALINIINMMLTTHNNCTMPRTDFNSQCDKLDCDFAMF